MLTWLSASGIKGLPSRSIGFAPGLTGIVGPVGIGKSILLRDMLFLLLAGKVPGKRTLGSIGKNFQAACSLTKGQQTLTVSRSGSAVTILETQASGAATVCEQVAAFTGIPTASLVDLCYCSGLTLPATVLTSGAVLSLVRSAVGSGLQDFSKQVGTEVSRRKAELDRARLQMQTIVGDPAALRAELIAMGNMEKQLTQWLQDQSTNQQISRQVMGCADQAESQRVIAQLQEQLGSVAQMSSTELESLLGRIHILRFAKECVDAALARYGCSDGLPPGTDSLFAELFLASKQAEQMGKWLGVNGTDLRAAYNSLQYTMKTPVTTAENRQMAQKFLEAYDAKNMELNILQGRINDAKRNLQAAESADERRTNLQRQLELDSQVLAQLDNLLGFVQPSGKFSVEKQITETLFSRLLTRSSDLLNAAGVRGKLEYTAAGGLTLDRPEIGVMSVDELSGGEVTLAALTLRLSVIETLKRAPFLVLDDITGPLGPLTPDTCDMLRGWSAETGIQSVVITHDHTARCDHLVTLR